MVEASLEALARLGPAGKEKAVAAVCTCLGHHDSRIRMVALDVLPQATDGAGTLLIEQAVSALGRAARRWGQDEEVLREVVEKLVNYSKQGHNAAIEVLRAGSTDRLRTLSDLSTRALDLFNKWEEQGRPVEDVVRANPEKRTKRLTRWIQEVLESPQG